MPPAMLNQKNRLASITNQNPTVGQAVESIRSACDNLSPAAVVSCTVAALTTLADAAGKDPQAADAVAAVRSVTSGAKPYTFRDVTVEVLSVLKGAVERLPNVDEDAGPAA